MPPPVGSPELTLTWAAGATHLNPAPCAARTVLGPGDELALVRLFWRRRCRSCGVLLMWVAPVSLRGNPGHIELPAQIESSPDGSGFAAGVRCEWVITSGTSLGVYLDAGFFKLGGKALLEVWHAWRKQGGE